METSGDTLICTVSSNPNKGAVEGRSELVREGHQTLTLNAGKQKMEGGARSAAKGVREAGIYISVRNRSNPECAKPCETAADRRIKLQSLGSVLM